MASTEREDIAYASGVPQQAWRRNWIAFRTIVVKEIRRFTRIWAQTLLPSVITTTLYLLIFGGLIGSRVGPMGGHDYMAFIVPGVIMLSVITNSYGNVVASFFGAKFGGFVQELLVAPVPNWLILAGFVSGGVIRGLITAVLVSTVAFALTDFTVQHPGLTLLVAVLTALMFSLAGFINAVFAQSFDDISIIPTFVLTPLTYLGGVFYSIDLLPDFWRTLSLANPVLYMVNAFRHGILGASDVNPYFALGMLGLFIALLGSMSLWLMHRGYGIKS